MNPLMYHLYVGQSNLSRVMAEDALVAELRCPVAYGRAENTAKKRSLFSRKIDLNKAQRNNDSRRSANIRISECTA